jgi:hypothetical protein
MPESTVVPTKKPTINVVVSDERKAAIAQWADDEGRTQSNLCERLLMKAAQDAGYLSTGSDTLAGK